MQVIRGRKILPKNKLSSTKILAGFLIYLGLLSGGIQQPLFAQTEGALHERIKSQGKELEKIKKEIEQHRAKSKELDKEETSVLRRLSAIDKEIELSEKLLKELEGHQTLLTEQIDSLNVSIVWERNELGERKTQLTKRLRQLYKREPHFRWEVLLGSESIHTALQRYKYLKIVAERDAKLLREVRERKSALEREQATLTETLADVAAIRATEIEENDQLNKKKKSRVAMLSRIRNEKTRHEQAIHDLEKARAELQDLIEELEQRRASDEQRLGNLGDFAKLKGALIRPVEGKVIRSFGRYRHPKFGTETFNSGIDIQAQPGTPIRAVAKGIVEFVDWIAGYGKCIILNHGKGYYTLYAHLSGLFVKQGQVIEGGEVIAEVGDSGSINGFECHFEIRKSRQALNPMEWFAK